MEFFEAREFLSFCCTVLSSIEEDRKILEKAKEQFIIVHNIIHESGEITSVSSLPDGTKHGEWKFFFSNGNLSMKRTYSDGKIKKCESWNKNGTPWKKHDYDVDELVNGEQWEWYENLQIKQIIKYEHGTRHGKYIIFFSDGKLAEEGEYIKGKKFVNYLSS